MREREANIVQLSIIIPVYNLECQLRRCLESVLNQQLAEFEVIVVDDGSADGSLAIAEWFQKQYTGRLRIIRQLNSGCAASRMRGLAAAKGHYVGFVDGDDWVSAGMFLELYQAAIDTGCDIAQCRYCLAYPDGSVVFDEDYTLQVSDAILNDPLSLAASRPTIWRRIYRRSFLLAHNIVFPEHIRRFDDTAFHFETLMHARSMFIHSHVGYFYRQERPGQDITATDGRLFAFMDIFQWLDGRLPECRNRDVEEQLLRLELNCHVWALNVIDKHLKKSYRRLVLRRIARGSLRLSYMRRFRIASSLNKQSKHLMLAAGWGRILQSII